MIIMNGMNNEYITLKIAGLCRRKLNKNKQG